MIPHLLFSDGRFRAQHRSVAPLQARISRAGRWRVRPLGAATGTSRVSRPRLIKPGAGAWTDHGFHHDPQSRQTLRRLSRDSRSQPRYRRSRVRPCSSVRRAAAQSTLLRIIAGLEPISAGDIFIGQDLRSTALPEAKRDNRRWCSRTMRSIRTCGFTTTWSSRLGTPRCAES